MKHTFFTVLVFITMASMGQEVCEPNGVSTHPDNPANPAAPSPLWLNEFNWYDHEGTTLYQYALNDMLNYNPNQFNMTHPYDYPNSYGYLIDPIPGPNTIDDLDMFPEDGWELLSVNLGAYPNGALLSEQSPPQQSGLSEIPYLLLYNKNRGIIRLFANSLTGLTPMARVCNPCLHLPGLSAQFSIHLL